MLKITSKILKNEEKLTIAYFGGSITQGAGIPDRSKSWRGQTTKWFKENYPKSEIVEIDASLGGTGSDLGIFRLEENVLKHNPNLIFVEFVVNDSILKDCEIYEENIIRKILDYSLDADIVLVRTTRDTMYEKAKNNEFCDSYLFYEKLADKYDLDFIDIGKAFFDFVDNGGSFKDLTVDGVHPNQNGYDILANTMIEFLKSKIYPIPFITDDRYMTAKMFLPKDIEKTNFSLCDVSFGKLDGCLTADEKGKSLEFEFTGCSIGILFHSAKDTGCFEYYIDGVKGEIVNTWDEYCRTFNRANYKVLATNLQYTKHVIKIVVLGEKSDESEGTNIRIGALLVA